MKRGYLSGYKVGLLLLAGAAWLGCSSSKSGVDASVGDTGGQGGRASGGSGGGGASGDAATGGSDAPVTDGAVSDVGEDGGPDKAPPLTANRPERRDVTATLIQQLRVPTGFQVAVYASGVTNARMLALGPDGAIYVTTPMSSQVLRLKDGNGDGDADDPGERTVAVSAAQTPSLEGVHGITFHEGTVYLASTKNVVSGALTGTGAFGSLTTLVSDLPDGGQHPYRTLAVGPDGKLYVSVGSDCNNCRESNSEHATLLRLNLDGTAATNAVNAQHPMLAVNPASKISPRIWASGLRNTIGFDWHPTTNALWGIDQGSDGLGEDTPPEEINQLAEGKSYGWPFCWGAQQVDPTVDEPSQTLSKAAYCATTMPATSSTLPAHSSPIAFLFYRGMQFPAGYRNSGLLVLRGSWGRAVPDGYKVVRVNFQDGVPTALPGSTVPYDDFLAGFLIENGAAHFGRLAGLTTDSDGSVLVSDDTNGTIYRVSYVATSATDAGVD